MIEFGRPTIIGPFYQVASLAEDIMNEHDNSTVFQLFECASCNHIVRLPEPNTFNEVGQCHCGAETDLVKAGCGFLAVIGDPEKVISASIDAEYGPPQGLPS
jgi:hypothetical protein